MPVRADDHHHRSSINARARIICKNWNLIFRINNQVSIRSDNRPIVTLIADNQLLQKTVHRWLLCCRSRPDHAKPIIYPTLLWEMGRDFD
jgi:hypothetical protein